MKYLSGKPFYSSLVIIIWLPLLIFFLNIFLTIILGMKTFDENRIDKVLHLLGGVSISLSAAGVLWHLIRRQIIELQDVNVFRVVVLGFACFAVISWEILEYIVPYAPEYWTYSDTITDMICGLIGGLLALFFIRRPCV